MSYLTTTYYSGNGCTTVQTAAVVAVPNCEAIAVAPSYRNCTVDTANSNPLLQRETKIDCVTAASPAAAFRQFAGIEVFNSTDCTTTFEGSPMQFTVLNRCQANTVASSSKGIVEGNMVKSNAYAGTACEGPATLQFNATIGACTLYFGGTSMKVSTYSANSGSSSKVSWGMVFAVVLSQLL